MLRAATGAPQMDAKGNITMSFVSKKATSNIIYRTVGWMAHKEKYPDKNPSSNKKSRKHQKNLSDLRFFWCFLDW